MNFENRTQFPAAWTLGFEPDGRELLIIVVKATYSIPKNGGSPELVDQQVPLVEADEFTGEPGASATLYETDYAHRKPYCDILLNGSAHAPGGRPAELVGVSLQVGTMKKRFNVIGDRKWDRFLMQDTPTLPLKFQQKAISYDFAFGGKDKRADQEEKTKTYLLNPVGVGYYPFSTGKDLEGKPLPNTEETGKPVKAAKTGKFRPMAFGPLGRNFGQRLKYAGTYDQQWLEHRVPFLPDDFDSRYFQAAPRDQLIAYPHGGEPVILQNLSPSGAITFVLPQLQLPILIDDHRHNTRQVLPNIDTILLEPDLERFTMTARVSLPLMRNCFEIKTVVVGESMKAWRRKQRAGTKPHFKGLAEFIDARKRGRI